MRSAGRRHADVCVLDDVAPLPPPQAIVQYSGVVDSSLQLAHPGVKLYSWADFMALGKEDKGGKLEAELQARTRDTRPGHCCSLIYTSGTTYHLPHAGRLEHEEEGSLTHSLTCCGHGACLGTTGPPKAVLLSHDNMTWASTAVQRFFPDQRETDCLVSYLPLSHVAAQARQTAGRQHADTGSGRRAEELAGWCAGGGGGAGCSLRGRPSDPCMHHASVDGSLSLSPVSCVPASCCCCVCWCLVCDQAIDVCLALHCGGCVYFAQPDALKGSLIHTLLEVPPTTHLLSASPPSCCC